MNSGNDILKKHPEKIIIKSLKKRGKIVFLEIDGGGVRKTHTMNCKQTHTQTKSNEGEKGLVENLLIPYQNFQLNNLLFYFGKIRYN